MSIEDVIFLIKDTEEDAMCPRNVRNTLDEAKKYLVDDKQDRNLRVSAAVYAIQKITDDPNIPTHIRDKL
ncbi:MAG: UPF0147 family protein, partial [Candidatus Anstonellales archaeon]